MKKILLTALALTFLGLGGPVVAQDPPADLEGAAAVEDKKDAEKSSEEAVKAVEDLAKVPNPAVVEEVKKEEAKEGDTKAPVEPLAEGDKPDPKVPENAQEVVEEVSFLIRAAKNGQWSLFAGFLILVLIWIGNKAGLKEKVGSKALPWVSVGLGVLASIGVMLASGIAVDEAIISGLLAGLAATGGWELIFKHLFKEKEEEPKPEKPAEA